MADLRVNWAGVKMRNPIGVAPLNGAIGYARKPKVAADELMKHAEAGAGFVYISHTRPTRSSPAENKPALKFIKAQCPGFAKREGLFVTGDVEACVHYLDSSLETLSIVKKQLPDDVPVIGDVSGFGADPDSWAKIAKEFEDAGADAIELDTACPITIVSSEKMEGSVTVDTIAGIDTKEMETLRKLNLAPSVGDTPEVLGPIVRACADAVEVPIGVKPSAEAGFPKCVAIAKICADNGATFVTNINAPLSVAPPQIYNNGRSPYESVNFRLNPIGAVSGPWDRYQCYKTTATIAFFVPEIDVAAVGGIVNSEHVVEMLMLGAKHVHLSSGLFWKGRKFITDSVAFLDRFMDEHGYEKMTDLIGIGLKHMGFVDSSIDWEEDKIATRVDKEKCIQCGVCTDFYCPVPTTGDDGFPFIDESLCQGCGLCVAICPGNALSVVHL